MCTTERIKFRLSRGLSISLTFSQNSLKHALLWQESKDGEVDGAMELRAGAVCAALVDLIVLDRVEIEIDQKSLLGIKYENSLLKVKLHSIRL